MGCPARRDGPPDHRIEPHRQPRRAARRRASRWRSPDALAERGGGLVRLVRRDRRARDPRRPALRRRQRRLRPRRPHRRPSTRATISATPTARSGRSSTTASTSRISTRPSSPPTRRSTAASAACSRSSPATDDTVWVHDYHFLLMGQEMRASGWDGPHGLLPAHPLPGRRRSSPRCPSTSAWPAASAPSTSSASRPSATPRTSAAISLNIAGGIVLDDGRVQVFDRRVARRHLLDRHRPRRHRRARRGRGGPRRRRAPRADHRQPRAGHRRRPHGLFQGPAAAHGGLRPDARRPRGAARPRQLPADRAALARGGRRLPGAARGARPPRRPDQRRLCRPRLDADPLPRPQLSTAAPSAASTGSPASASSRRSTTA